MFPAPLRIGIDIDFKCDGLKSEVYEIQFRPLPLVCENWPTKWVDAAEPAILVHRSLAYSCPDDASRYWRGRRHRVGPNADR